MASPYRILDFDQIQIQIQVDQLDEQSLREHLAAESTRIKARIRERPLNDTRKVIVIVDTSCTLMPSAGVRKVQAEWMKENTELLRMVCHATAFVIPDGMIRNTLTAILWLAPMPAHVSTHSSMDQALDWAITELDKHGWDVHPSILMEGAMAVEKAKVAIDQERTRLPRTA